MLDQANNDPIYVLIVEDDRDDFFLTQDVLNSVTGRKYAVAWAGSYDSGATALFEQRFDVALVDYHIGERTGLEFITAMAKRYPECPMILLTGVDNPDVDRAAENAGAADFLVKDALSPDLLDRAIRYARKHAERKRLLSAVLDHAAVGMVALDPRGKAQIWNREALRALELTDKNPALISGGDIEQAIGALARDGRLPEEYRTRADEAFEIGKNDVPGGDHVVVFQDVTKRARNEQLLRQTAADAEAANRAKSSFLATMSHELRTPLNGILGMVRVLEATMGDQSQLAYVETIKSSSLSLLAIINDVLDLSKIEAGKFELDDADVELAPLVEDVVNLLAPTAFDKGLDLAAYVAPDLPRTMRGDPVRLRQILTNLVGNAVKFTSEGSVTVRVLPDPQAPGSRARIDVTDTGIGISPANQAKLFQKFSQVDSSLARRSGGTGLGLAICRELLSLMGGNIWCESEVGHGATFAISLKCGPENKAVTGAALSKFAHMHGRRVLLLTQSRAARSVLDSWLETVGGRLVVATDEAGVLAAVKSGSIDAVVLDRFGGLLPSATLQRLPRSLPPGARTRFFMLSEDQLDGSSGGYRILSRPLAGRTLEVLGSELKPAQTAKPAAASATVKVPSAGPATHKLRILLAEDNHPNRLVATALLKSAGYGLEIVGNGREAVEAASSGRFDIVLMDVNMPVMDGLEATRQLRAVDATKHMPIIGLTANAMTADRQNCLAAGMSEHISKPIDWDQLLALLGRLEGELYGASKVA